MLLNEIYRSLLNEAQFTKEILGIGVTQIRKANYSQKGIYHQSFICLTTGLERLGKLCLLLNYYIDNTATFPDDNYLRKKLGHDILRIYNDCIDIINKKSIRKPLLVVPTSQIHLNILSILSEFAQGNRYSNINVLVGVKQREDSLKQWYQNVDMPLFEKHISVKRKSNIHQKAAFTDSFLSSIAIVRHVSEEGDGINDIYTGSFRTGIWEAVAPYRQLYLLQIIRMLTILLTELGYKAAGFQNEDIPYFSEVFGAFCNRDSYFRSRKTWDGF